MVNHFHFNINVPKTIDEASNDLSEQPPQPEPVRISAENRRSIRESYVRMKASIEKPPPEDDELPPLETDDLDQLYSTMRQSIRDAEDGPDKYKSYMREDSTSSDDDNADDKDLISKSGSKFLEDYVKSLTRLTRRNSQSRLTEGPKFDPEMLRKLSVSDIGRQTGDRVLSSVEAGHTTAHARQSSLPSDNFFLEDLVNEGNTVRDFKKFQDIQPLAPSQLTSKNGTTRANDRALAAGTDRLEPGARAGQAGAASGGHQAADVRELPLRGAAEGLGRELRLEAPELRAECEV